MQKIIPLLSIFALSFILNGCSTSSNIKVSETGVSVSTPDAKIEVSESGVIVDSSSGSISITDTGIEVTGEAFSQGEGTDDVFSDENCDAQYDSLLKKYGNSYEGCFALYPEIDSCKTASNIKPKVNVAVIFDTSGSMGAKIGSETMMNLAKVKLSEYVNSLGSEVSGGIILYGHKGNGTDAEKANSCNGVELLGEFNTDRQKLLSDISKLQPNGWTPIDASLKKAEAYLKEKANPEDKNIILLISDGKETCDGNPVATAKAIASTPGMYIDVIGFNVSGGAQEELISIAKNGNGKYSDVRSRADFENVFQANKNYLNALSCSASKASLQIQAAVERKNTYYSCLYMLKEEEVKIITNASNSCKDTIMSKLENRSSEYSQILEAIGAASEKLLESFDKNIEMVENSFEK